MYYKQGVVVFVISFMTWVPVNPLKCYACTYFDNPDENGHQCITDPDNFGSGVVRLECDEDEWCLTERQRYKGHVDVYALRRSCGPRDRSADTCLRTKHMVHCYWYCQTDLCNDANGYNATVYEPPRRTARPRLLADNDDDDDYTDIDRLSDGCDLEHCAILLVVTTFMAFINL
ncbi:unnamed protein product [Owenia fusiformis]|uniref:Uncharacterized protein n=1 Tax=Owenia fusiformis TaxID=6347 RepID=A0A8J1TRS7_OWEFU|nr:unnamed protein product [Owenia fusiformis]